MGRKEVLKVELVRKRSLKSQNKRLKGSSRRIQELQEKVLHWRPFSCNSTSSQEEQLLACSWKNYQCMMEEIKLAVFLAQKSRHIVKACGKR